MNILDENISASQRIELRRWHIPFRQVGREIADSGTSDAQLIPLLQRCKNATFFTRDFDFFKSQLCHASYCIAWLNVRPDEVALFIRRFLNHNKFDTHQKRLGKIVRIHPGGIAFFERREPEIVHIPWSD